MADAVRLPFNWKIVGSLTIVELTFMQHCETTNASNENLENVLSQASDSLNTTEGTEPVLLGAIRLADGAHVTVPRRARRFDLQQFTTRLTQLSPCASSL